MGASNDDQGSPQSESGRAIDLDHYTKRRDVTMLVKLSYLVPLLGAGAAAAAIVAAPIAAASPHPAESQASCTMVGGGSSGVDTRCESPGNVQIRNNPPAVQFYPYGGGELLLGGHGARP